MAPVEELTTAAVADFLATLTGQRSGHRERPTSAVHRSESLGSILLEMKEEA